MNNTDSEAHAAHAAHAAAGIGASFGRFGLGLVGDEAAGREQEARDACGVLDGSADDLKSPSFHPE